MWFWLSNNCWVSDLYRVRFNDLSWKLAKQRHGYAGSQSTLHRLSSLWKNWVHNFLPEHSFRSIYVSTCSPATYFRNCDDKHPVPLAHIPLFPRAIVPENGAASLSPEDFWKSWRRCLMTTTFDSAYEGCRFKSVRNWWFIYSRIVLFQSRTLIVLRAPFSPEFYIDQRMHPNRRHISRKTEPSSYLSSLLETQFNTIQLLILVLRRWNICFFWEMKAVSRRAAMASAVSLSRQPSRLWSKASATLTYVDNKYSEFYPQYLIHLCKCTWKRDSWLRRYPSAFVLLGLQCFARRYSNTTMYHQWFVFLIIDFRYILIFNSVENSSHKSQSRAFGWHRNFDRVTHFSKFKNSTKRECC
jgi:hypothetical protein